VRQQVRSPSRYVRWTPRNGGHGARPRSTTAPPLVAQFGPSSWPNISVIGRALFLLGEVDPNVPPLPRDVDHRRTRYSGGLLSSRAADRMNRSANLISTISVALALGCGGRANGTNGDEGGCIAVGGQCLIGSAVCAGQAATQFSCGGITPAGFYCCLPSDSGSSDEGGPGSAVGAAQAFAIVTVGRSAAFPGQCTSYASDTTVDVGQPGTSSSQPVLVTSGTVVPSVQIGCSVHPQGSSYAVNLQLSQGTMLSGTGRMSLTVMGLVDPTAGATMDVLGEVSTNNGDEFNSSTCSVNFNTPGAGASPSGPPIAPGRIWAHLSCPAAQNAAMVVGTGPETCDVEADFIFENCGQ
jgi:hypothetical protein